MSSCSGIHRERLFIGEGNFTGVSALLKKHEDRHPTLGKSIVATELETFGRTSEECSDCTFILFRNLFLEKDSEKEPLFCGNRCERIEALKAKGVKVLLGFNGIKIHENIDKIGRHRIRRIHWNCPHDGSNIKDQTLPEMLKEFFISASQVQCNGDRVYVTLAQPEGRTNLYYSKASWYQGACYDICEAAESNGYLLYIKRYFQDPSSNNEPQRSPRYPGYKHEKTKIRGESAEVAERLREFVFIKGLTLDKAKSRIYKEHFFIPGRGSIERKCYSVDTDYESSDYSDSEDSKEEEI